MKTYQLVMMLMGLVAFFSLANYFNRDKTTRK